MNKSVIYNKRTKNIKKLEILQEIENFMFKDVKKSIIIDFNPKILIEHKIPKF